MPPRPPAHRRQRAAVVASTRLPVAAASGNTGVGVRGGRDFHVPLPIEIEQVPDPSDPPRRRNCGLSQSVCLDGVRRGLTDHRGLVLNDPMGPMARLQLARALSASGDRAKSVAVYMALLALWKDADPD